jgi:hypothetical protein
MFRFLTRYTLNEFEPTVSVAKAKPTTTAPHCFAWRHNGSLWKSTKSTTTAARQFDYKPRDKKQTKKVGLSLVARFFLVHDTKTWKNVPN